MLKRLAGAALAVLMLVGCASDKEYIRAQSEAITAQSNARVAEAQAIVAVSSKLDAGGASAYVLATALAKVQGSGQQGVARPRDFLDYLNAFTSVLGVVGNIAVPIVTVNASSKVQRAGYERDVYVEQARQNGESTRTMVWGQVMNNVASRPPTNTTTNTTTFNAGGDLINNGGTIDRRTCNANAGPGGNAGSPSTGSAPGGTGGSAGC